MASLVAEDEATHLRKSAVQRAQLALTRLAATSDALLDPLLVCALDWLRRSGQPVDVARPLAALWSRHRSTANHSALRYRWDLSFRTDPGSSAYRLPEHIPLPAWRATEAREARSESAHSRRLMEPIVLAAQFGFWRRVAEDGSVDPQVARDAAALLDEARPIAEDALSTWFAAGDPWRDTFGLWLLTADREASDTFHALLFSLALRYGPIAKHDGAVRGVKYPFYQRPLVSASAQLALGLWRCGVYPSVTPDLLAQVAACRDRGGGWGDDGHAPDLLTTLVAADVLLRLDPDFDPGPTVRYFVERQEPTGWWRVLNPETPWLTTAIARWLELVDEPFAERFEWPSPSIWARDRLSELPTIASLEELEIAVDGLPRLGRQPVEVAFVDLAGFGAWNTRYGQSRGDDVIGLLGRTLRELPDALPVRIGGDEVFVIGKPAATNGALWSTLDRWRRDWPSRLAGVGPGSVAPRIVVHVTRAAGLRGARNELGIAIGRLKATHPSPPPDGVQRWLSDVP